VSWSGAGAAVETYALAKHSPLLFAARAHEITASGPLSFPRQLSELSSVLAPNAQGQETGGYASTAGKKGPPPPAMTYSIVGEPSDPTYQIPLRDIRNNL